MIIVTTRWMLAIKIALLFLLACLVLFVKAWLPSLGEYRGNIEQALSKQLGMQVVLEGISADWRERDLYLDAQKLAVTHQPEQGPGLFLTAEKISAELDLVRSLFEWSLVFERLQVSDFTVELDQRDGQWIAIGPNSTPDQPQMKRLGAVIGLLKDHHQVIFDNARLILSAENGVNQVISPIELKLENTSQQHHLSGSFSVPLFGEDASLSFAVESGPIGSDPLNTNYSLYLKFERLGQALLGLDLVDLPVPLEKLSLDSELWANWRAGQFSRLTGRVGIDQLKFENSDWALSDSQVDMAMAPTEQGYQLQLDNLKIKDQQQQLGIEKLLLDIAHSPGKTEFKSLALSRLDLAPLTKWLQDHPVLPAKAQEYLDALNPRGSLLNITAVRNGDELLDYQLAADLEKVSVDGYDGIPSLLGVSGLLQAQGLSGSIDLDAEGFTLGFPELFAKDWRFDSASGRVSWSIGEIDNVPLLTLSSGLLAVENSDAKGNGRFSLWLPLDSKVQSELVLQIGLLRGDGGKALQFVPREEVGEATYKWLSEALKGGEVTRGALTLRAGTRSKAEASQPVVQLQLEGEKLQLNYDASWPQLSDGKFALYLDNQALSIEASQGKLLNQQLSKLTADLHEDTGRLAIKAQLQGPGKDLHTLFDGPLRDYVGDLGDWRIDGALTSQLNLDLPLDKGNPKVAVSSQLTRGGVNSKATQVTLTGVSGALDFSTEKGLKGQFKGALDAQPVNLEVTGNLERTELSFSGQLAPEGVVRWVPQAVIPLLAGTPRYHGRLVLCEGQNDCNLLTLNSQLTGVAVNAPYPLGKIADEAVPLTVISRLGQTQHWRYNYNNVLRGVYLQAPGEAAFHHLMLGGQRPELPQRSGTKISGRLDYADAEQYLALLSGDTASADTGAVVVDLALDQLQLGSMLANQTKLNYRSDSKQLIFSSQLAKGQLTLAERGKPYVLNLDYLRLPDESNGATLEDDSPLSTADWPQVKFAVASISKGQQQLGSWQGVLLQDQGGYAAKNLTGKLADMTITGAAGWVVNDSAKPVSYVNLQAKGQDAGKPLAALGYQAVLESELAQLSANLNWSGYPWSLRSDRLNGQLSFLLKKGRITEAGTSGNFLRIFGLLNLNTVVRRLQLNFSDLVEQGLIYDRVSARYSLTNGVAESVEALRLDGPSARVTMRGDIDLSSKTLDQIMQVELPLTSNAPLAALLLGAPQVAGVAFIVDALIGDQIQQLTALRYQVSGSWDDPQIQVPKSGSNSNQK